MRDRARGRRGSPPGFPSVLVVWLSPQRDMTELRISAMKTKNNNGEVGVVLRRERADHRHNSDREIFLCSFS